LFKKSLIYPPKKKKKKKKVKSSHPEMADHPRPFFKSGLATHQIWEE